jgi:hypothetical protein
MREGVAELFHLGVVLIDLRRILAKPHQHYVTVVLLFEFFVAGDLIVKNLIIVA